MTLDQLMVMQTRLTEVSLQLAKAVALTHRTAQSVRGAGRGELTVVEWEKLEGTVGLARAMVGKEAAEAAARKAGEKTS